MSYPTEFRFLPYYSPTITQQWEYSSFDGLWHGINNCVGHAFDCLMSYLHKANTLNGYRFSYQWVYGNRSTSDHQIEGMWIYEALPHLMNEGVPTYSDMPYQNTYNYISVDDYPDPNSTSASLSDVPLAKNDVQNRYSALIGTSTQYRISGWGNVSFSDINTMKSKVMKAPVILDIDIADLDTSAMYYCSSLETAIIQHQVDSDPTGSGYHALLVIGWTVINGVAYWVVRNNWGGAWGYSGLALLPMTYNLVRQAYYVTPNFSPISSFSWDYTRVSGMSYKLNKIKATEWNRLNSVVQSLYSRFYGSTYYLTTAVTGNQVTYTIFNSMVNIINSMANKNGLVTMAIPTVYTGDDLYADYFNQISSKVNELVSFANS